MASSEPKRIQMRRTKGWRKPAGAIYVGRPTKWGNPFVVGDRVEVRAMGSMFGDLVGRYDASDERGYDAVILDGRLTAQLAVDLFRQDLASTLRYVAEDAHAPDEDRDVAASLVLLRGHDLACWCSLDQPCHADVLLEIANG